ncbi:bifunctional diaminohydroxyphosphoribosylaminopyrimidine deaminase/5-amino-6-(5-phosphoribosylamino)uracil reductase RibD [Longimicrobium terrae]|uniref:Riboflavin biosynthesis protein RibD n=1 Tax=Longimicrobium terrae TaxID=1639882 RepID=A0A841GVJ4_9BACT|nr:diaminohydroxyphosphoribosylaminopyrimidine deaminase/5-amino-6-(5-phosphoribosylamino)uracil reductase [Longimicrobium terrae]MBB6069758.1 diaminohydroxyphosphoribosylaminopyrimidine deaminase/5-amino-6-(5-phosphoribosylamino)uracil reductase [Longimicrobium terrae]
MSGISETDREWMRRAVALAERGWGRTAPNPMVGCVIVRGGSVVGEGWHTEYGCPHAEPEALRAAGEAAQGATAYVSLEPCSHWGKTPPCTDALIAAGVSRVVFGGFDPNPRASGGGSVLREAGIDAVGGVEERAVRDQNAVFFHTHSLAGTERPFIALKLAMSLDARIADRDGRSVWITGEESRAEVHRLRAGYDAVAAGIGTALADDPQLTVRGAVVPRVAPARIVFDRSLRLPLSSALVRTAAEVPVWAVCAPDADAGRRDALEAAGVRVVAADGLAAQLRALRGAGAGSMFVEGGAAFASALLAADVVDRMYLFYAPVLIGPDGGAPFGTIPNPALADAPRWRRLATDTFGADTRITLARR